MIVIAGYAYFKEDKIETVLPLIDKLVTESNKENGCISYQFYRDLHDPTKFIFFEEWINFEALENHFTTPHLKEYGRHLPDVLARELEVRRYHVDEVVNM